MVKNSKWLVAWSLCGDGWSSCYDCYDMIGVGSLRTFWQHVTGRSAILLHAILRSHFYANRPIVPTHQE